MLKGSVFSFKISSKSSISIFKCIILSEVIVWEIGLRGSIVKNSLDWLWVYFANHYHYNDEVNSRNIAAAKWFVIGDESRTDPGSPRPGWDWLYAGEMLCK